MEQHTPYLIGLTGGIGSGKSTVADLFRERGVEVIDADDISHALVKSGSPLLHVIRDHFGPEIIDEHGDLDRQAMRRIVFEDHREKTWLENLLHPAIREQIHKQVRDCHGDYVILVVPLLLESGQYGFVDRVLVVDVPENVQVDRAMSRDDCSMELVRRIMDSQLSRQERLQRADDVLDNTIPLDQLETSVDRLHRQYLEAARLARDD